MSAPQLAARHPRAACDPDSARRAVDGAPARAGRGGGGGARGARQRPAQAARSSAAQSVYLLRGRACARLRGRRHAGGGRRQRGRAPAAEPAQTQQLARAKAITDVELLRIDDDLLDIMATWDQVAAERLAATAARPWRARCAATRGSSPAPSRSATCARRLRPAAGGAHRRAAQALRAREGRRAATW